MRMHHTQRRLTYSSTEKVSQICKQQSIYWYTNESVENAKNLTESRMWDQVSVSCVYKIASIIFLTFLIIILHATISYLLWNRL